MMAKHDAIMNKEAMPESIAGTQTPSRFKTFDGIKQATEDKAQETYKKADQISAEEQQVYANKVAEATAENDAMWKRHLQNVKDYNDNLATGETPMAVPAEKPAPNIPERPLTYGEVKGALDRAKAESTSSDAAVREDAYTNRIPKAEKAVDNWFKQHSDEISPEEYDSAKKLYVSSQRFGDIANGLRSSLNKGTLTGNTLRGLEANIDNKMIRRGQAPGTFQRLLGPDAYDNWKNVSKLFDRAQNTPKSLGMYGAEWIAAHLLGPYGLAGKFATEFLLNRVLFDPAWGQWFGKFTTTMKNLMTRTHELGLPGTVGEPFGEESPENLKGEFGRLMHQEAGTIPADTSSYKQQAEPQLGEPQHQMTSLGTHNVISADVNPPSLTPEVLKWRGQPQPKLAPDYSNLQDIANQMNANVTPEDILTSTAHELGHAFAQHFYGANSDNMSINLGHSVMDPTSETGPKTTAYGVSSGYLDPGGGWEKQYKEARSNPEKMKVFSENYLTGLMSGRAMEELLGIPPDRIQIHISNDMKMAQGVLRALDIPFNDYRPILQAATERARDIIRDNFDTFRHMTAQAVNHYGGEKIDAKTFHKYRQGGIYGK